MEESKQEQASAKQDMEKHAPYFRETIYRAVFTEPESALALYQSLDPEAAQSLTIKDILPLSVRSVPKLCYDCVAFRAGDVLVIVQDAGQEFSDIRLSNGAYYIAEAVTAYASAEDIDLYGNERVSSFPEPRCWVLCAGDDAESGRRDGTEVECSLGSVTYKPVIRTRGSVPGDILDQYIAVGVICDEEAEKHRSPDEASHAIARMCLERGLLPQYFTPEAETEEN